MEYLNHSFVCRRFLRLQVDCFDQFVTGDQRLWICGPSCWSAANNTSCSEARWRTHIHIIEAIELLTTLSTGMQVSY